MPDALLPPDAPANDRVRRTVAALASAIARVARGERAAAWQDGLDLVALLAGMKPVCLVGRGFYDREGVEAMRHVATEAGLATFDGAPWQPLAAADDLPDWYIAATARHGAAHPVLYICNGERTLQAVAVLCARGRVAARDEAELLSYPPCCVAAHHRQALALERFVAGRAMRIAGGDVARAARMIAAGAAPLPATAEEWRRWDEWASVRPAPATSVNMCEACAVNPLSPARDLSRRYAALAASADYPPLDD